MKPSASRAQGRQHRLSQGLQAKYADRITGSFLIPGREAVHAPLPRELPEALTARCAVVASKIV